MTPTSIASPISSSRRHAPARSVTARSGWCPSRRCTASERASPAPTPSDLRAGPVGGTVRRPVADRRHRARSLTRVPSLPSERSGSFPTRTGTGSGTRRSRRTGSNSCTLVDDLLDLLESDSVVRALPARRPDRGGRRLPRSPSRRRGAAGRLSSPPGGSRSVRGRCSWTSSWCRARRIVRDLQLGMAARRRSSAVRCASATSRTCSATSRRCRRSCASPGSEHAVVWRGVPAAIDRTAFWWQAPDGSRVRAEYLYGSYSNGRELPSDPGTARRARTQLRARAGAGGAARWRRAADERLGSPPAAAWVGRRRGRGECDPARVPLRDHLAPRIPRRATNRGTSHVVRGAAFRCTRQRADGRRVEPGRRAPGRGRGRACARASRRTVERAVPVSRRLSALAARHRLAQPRAEQCARLVVRVQPRRRRRGREGALPGGAPHRRGALPSDALTTLATEIDAPPASTVIVNPSAVDRSGVVEMALPGTEPGPRRRPRRRHALGPRKSSRRAPRRASPPLSSDRRSAGCWR